MINKLLSRVNPLLRYLPKTVGPYGPMNFLILLQDCILLCCRSGMIHKLFSRVNPLLRYLPKTVGPYGPT